MLKIFQKIGGKKKEPEPKKKENLVPDVCRQRVIRLEVINDLFGDLLSTELSSLFQRKIKIFPISIDVVFFKNFLRQSCTNPITVRSLKTNIFQEPIFMSFPSFTVFSMIELMMGNENISEEDNRDYQEITKIERMLFKKVLSATEVSLEESLSSFFIDLNVDTHKDYMSLIELNSSFNLDAVYYDINFEIVVDDVEDEEDLTLDTLHVLLPYEGLKPYIPLLSQRSQIKAITTDLAVEDIVKIVSKRKEKKEIFRERNQLLNFSKTDNSDIFQFLEYSVYPEQLCNYLQSEHPQTIACVLSFLSPEYISKFLSYLDSESLSLDILSRITNLGSSFIQQPYFLWQVRQHLYSEKFPPKIHGQVDPEKIEDLMNSCVDTQEIKGVISENQLEDDNGRKILLCSNLDNQNQEGRKTNA